MAWALRRCDVYCTGCGFTWTQCYNKGLVCRHTVQCTCIVNTGVWNWGVLLLYLSGSCLGTYMTPSLDCTGRMFGDRRCALLIAAWKQAFREATAPVGQRLLIIEAARSHSDPRQSVGLLWTSDQPVAETSAWQHTTLTRDRQPCPWQDLNPYSLPASGRGPTP